MIIAYHMPSLNNIYAQRTIYWGFKNAFLDMGHEFHTFTSDDDLEKFLNKNKPDIFITSSHFYYQKYLDLDILKKYREKGMVLFTKIDFWDSPLSKLRVNEAKGLKNDEKTISLIKNGLLGDIFFHVTEQGDKRMDGFEQTTGHKFHTIPLAADKTMMNSKFNEKFAGNISYIGTYLPEKRPFFDNYVFPLRKQYDLRLYGQDWTATDRILGWTQRFGQYFNIPYLRSLVKPKLKLEDEPTIYLSSKICINVHEEFQKKFGGDCNERTFKIPLYGGFEITDDVACIRKYFRDGEEIVIAKDKKDWFEKINYYIDHPEERQKIIDAGKKRVLKDHTYNSRAQQIIDIYNETKNKKTN